MGFHPPGSRAIQWVDPLAAGNAEEGNGQGVFPGFPLACLDAANDGEQEPYNGERNQGEYTDEDEYQGDREDGVDEGGYVPVQDDPTVGVGHW